MVGIILKRLPDILITICTIITIFAYTPQIIKIINTKQSDDISVLSWFLWGLESICYLSYACLIGEKTFIIEAAVCMILTFINLILTIKYRTYCYNISDKDLYKLLSECAHKKLKNLKLSFYTDDSCSVRHSNKGWIYGIDYVQNSANVYGYSVIKKEVSNDRETVVYLKFDNYVENSESEINGDETQNEKIKNNCISLLIQADTFIEGIDFLAKHYDDLFFEFVPNKSSYYDDFAKHDPFHNIDKFILKEVIRYSLESDIKLTRIDELLEILNTKEFVDYALSSTPLCMMSESCKNQFVKESIANLGVLFVNYISD